MRDMIHVLLGGIRVERAAGLEEFLSFAGTRLEPHLHVILIVWLDLQIGVVRKMVIVKPHVRYTFFGKLMRSVFNTFEQGPCDIHDGG